MIAIICAIMAGVTIVLSRTVNGYLGQRIGVYQSTFFNYFTGLLLSIVVLLWMGIPTVGYDLTLFCEHPTFMIGGIIGVFNILILNLIVSKISPIQLTLICFIAQLTTGIILDYYIYDIFSINKLIGCFIVIMGLFMYQRADKNSHF